MDLGTDTRAELYAASDCAFLLASSGAGLMDGIAKDVVLCDVGLSDGFAFLPDS